MTKPCRCGAPTDSRGQCAHCDYPDRCHRRCAHCKERDRHCEVCHTKHLTPADAWECVKRCRLREREVRG